MHRDLKPENAIAGPDGAVTVIDLGLAWREGMTRHTDTGAAVGSVGYMAPEQVEGRAVGAAADVWALGVMLYEWIAGKRPFARARPAEEAAAMLVGVYARLDAADRRTDRRARGSRGALPRARPGRAPHGRGAGRRDRRDDRLDGRPRRRARRRRRRSARRTSSAWRASACSGSSAWRARRGAGKPFVAIALCDRGLAYAPDHPALLALVATAERGTQPAKPKRNWHLIGALALGLGGGAALVYVSMPGRHAHRAPEVTTTTTTGTTTGPATEADKELFRDFLGLFGRALAHGEAAAPAQPGETPTTARGWLQLASSQTPPEAVISIRHALALNPAWPEAQGALCIALAAAKDPGALAPCDTAVHARPGDTNVLAARGAAHLAAQDFTDAIADLDRVIAADPDPKWRRLRARARDGAGDREGAQKDLDDACQLGDAAACRR